MLHPVAATEARIILMPDITDARAGSLSIGELSRRTGVHIETIRYYEKVKMLPPPPRTEGGRRVYESSQIRTLTFIRRARELGFTLDEIRNLLGLSEPGRACCAEVQTLTAAHLGEVRAKIDDLRKLEALLASALEQCLGEPAPACPVLDMLASSRML
jgi:MerR family mercuric resistance operon transcriptional regulator